jgi:hypothetical protein
MPGMSGPGMSGSSALIETIRAAVIGDDEAVMGPFGLRASRMPTTRRPAAR